MKIAFIVLQYLLPKHLLSRLTGRLAECQTPWLKNALIKLFIKHYKVDMSEAADPEPENYPHFNAFFTRALGDGARPLAGDENTLVCPVDGVMSQLGKISVGRIFQAKGQDYGLSQLLAGDEKLAGQFMDGHFATIYLSPSHYHRVHMPVTGTLRSMHYVPGELFSVNQATAENVQGLFARNERLIVVFDTEAGPMAMVLVGALIVAAIETVWAGQIAPPPKQITHRYYPHTEDAITLTKGEEMGRFKLGSTVILLLGKDKVDWLENYQALSPTRLGEALAKLR